MEQARLRLLSQRGLPAWFVLLVALALTAAVWHLLTQRERATAVREFESQTDEIVQDIIARLRQHEQILLGGAGLFDAQGEIKRTQWRAYVERLRLAENYPGIQGVGFSTPILPKELARHIAAVRAEGFPQYTVRPPGERPLYTSIIYLEPFSERNLAAFGFDMYSEATRRKAIDAAIDSGRTSITGKVKLVQETHGKAQAGFLMYVPVYRGTPGSAEERRAQWRGNVYSPYRMDDLMRGILGQRKTLLRFTLHDGDAVNADSLMYDSVDEHGADLHHRPAHRVTKRIDAYGHSWTISLESRPPFEAQFHSRVGAIIPPIGIAFALALFALTWSLTTRREQALTLAAEMTRRSRENEARLSIINERFHLASTSAGIGVWEFLPDTGELIWDAQMRAIYHFAAAQPVDFAAWEQRLHGEDRQRMLSETTQAMERGTRLDTSFRIDIPDVGVRYIEVEAHSLTETGGRRRMIGVNRDITDKILAEQALAESAAQNAAIVDNAVDAIITIDEKGLMQSCNRATQRIFGYAPQELIGRNVNLLMPEPYRSSHDGYLAHYLHSGERRIIGIGREVAGQRADGSVFPMELTVSEARHRGQPLFVGMVRDISERKRSERMKNEFVSTVSHELRTPLTSISGSIALLAGGALGELPEAAKSMLEIAQRNSEQLQRLIDDLLDMEKIAAGKIVFHIKAQPLMPLIEQTLVSVAALAAKNQITIEITGRLDEAHVEVDSGRFAQILANFLSNAIKFSPAGQRIEISPQRRGTSVRIAVSDHGPGVPENFRTRLFEKFSQADSSDTREKGGTGLGLAISRELAQRMGGSVGYEPVLGGGSRFFIDLPEFLAGTGE